MIDAIAAAGPGVLTIFGLLGLAWCGVLWEDWRARRSHR